MEQRQLQAGLVQRFAVQSQQVLEDAALERQHISPNSTGCSCASCTSTGCSSRAGRAAGLPAAALPRPRPPRWLGRRSALAGAGAGTAFVNSGGHRFSHGRRANTRKIKAAMMPALRAACEPASLRLHRTYSISLLSGCKTALQTLPQPGRARGSKSGSMQQRHQACKASSSTSTQWRTGTSVPLCKCTMQPILANKMAAGAATASSSAFNLRSRKVLEITGCNTE